MAAGSVSANGSAEAIHSNIIKSCLFLVGRDFSRQSHRARQYPGHRLLASLDSESAPVSQVRPGVFSPDSHIQPTFHFVSSPAIQLYQSLERRIGLVSMVFQHSAASRNDVSKPNLSAQEQTDRFLIGSIDDCSGGAARRGDLESQVQCRKTLAVGRLERQIPGLLGGPTAEPRRAADGDRSEHIESASRMSGGLS